jgi:hypothetical protein
MTNPEMAGFTRVERDITLSGSPCEQVIDVTLTLRPRAAASQPRAV